jgi:hypothetical protein
VTEVDLYQKEEQDILPRFHEDVEEEYNDLFDVDEDELGESEKAQDH